MSLLWRGSLLLLLLLPHLSQGKNDDILDESNNCNYHPEDRERNRWISASSVAACSNKTICVKEGEGITGYHNASYYHNYKPTICTGNASCKGELQWCQGEERKNETCPGWFIRCPGISNKTKSLSGQCIDHEKLKDGEKNDCLDRSDEDPFHKAKNGTKKETLIDFSRLKNCTTADSGNPGLECSRHGNDSNCIWSGFLCRQKYRELCPVLGEDIYTDNTILCGNLTFWRKQPCGEKMVRCQGGVNSGQCVYKEYWGTEGAKDEYGDEPDICTDGSDLYRPVKKTTNVGKLASQNEQSNSQRNASAYGNQQYTIWEQDVNEVPQGQLWKTSPVKEDDYNAYYRYQEDWQNASRHEPDMEFVKNFTHPDFQAKSFTPQKCVICDSFFGN